MHSMLFLGLLPSTIKSDSRDAVVMNFDGCFVTNNRKVISKKTINIYFVYATLRKNCIMKWFFFRKLGTHICFEKM